MTDKKGMIPALIALALYLAGGAGIFSGMGLIGLMGGRDLRGWGEGRSIGYLLVCIGCSMTVLGVLLMRLVIGGRPVREMPAAPQGSEAGKGPAQPKPQAPAEGQEDLADPEKEPAKRRTP